MPDAWWTSEVQEPNQYEVRRLAEMEAARAPLAPEKPSKPSAKSKPDDTTEED